MCILPTILPFEQLHKTIRLWNFQLLMNKDTLKNTKTMHYKFNKQREMTENQGNFVNKNNNK